MVNIAPLSTATPMVVVVNPRSARDFGRATGEPAKTDRIDALPFARFAEPIHLKVRRLPTRRSRRY